jgi:hypothetical protein
MEVKEHVKQLRRAGFSPWVSSSNLIVWSLLASSAVSHLAYGAVITWHDRAAI